MRAMERDRLEIKSEIGGKLDELYAAWSAVLTRAADLKETGSFVTTVEELSFSLLLKFPSQVRQELRKRGVVMIVSPAEKGEWSFRFVRLGKFAEMLGKTPLSIYHELYIQARRVIESGRVRMDEGGDFAEISGRLQTFFSELSPASRRAAEQMGITPEGLNKGLPGMQW